MFRWLRRRTRPREECCGLSSQQQRVLESRVPYYRGLDPARQTKLCNRIARFLRDKHYEGCGGLAVTADMRTMIAAYACIPMLELEGKLYPRVASVLVYPAAYVSREPAVLPDGVVDEGPHERVGESWSGGAIVLSWSDVEVCGRGDGNVVVHEFSHQLDEDDGVADGIPQVGGRNERERWRRVLEESRETLAEACRTGWRARIEALDAYALESFPELFACASEAFFERPHALRIEYPDLHNALATFYRQDPATVLPPRPVPRRRRRPGPRTRGR